VSSADKAFVFILLAEVSERGDRISGITLNNEVGVGISEADCFVDGCVELPQFGLGSVWVRTVRTQD
jgi:hypothetical protein